MRPRLYLLAGLLASAAMLAGAAPQAPQPEEKLPSAREIFDRYAQAIGGRAAWEKITSRISRGTLQVEGLDGTGSMLIYERAPNLQAAILTLPNGAIFRQGFDGRGPWEQGPNGEVDEITGARGFDNRAEADFYSEIDLDKLYPHARTAGRQTVDGRQAYVVEGSIPGGTMRRMYFEVDTGLRFRTEVYANALSPAPTSVLHYDEYHDLDGIKIPFKGSVEGAGPSLHFRFVAVRQNVPVSDDEIARPVSAGPAAK